MFSSLVKKVTPIKRNVAKIFFVIFTILLSVNTINAQATSTSFTEFLKTSKDFSQNIGNYDVKAEETPTYNQVMARGKNGNDITEDELAKIKAEYSAILAKPGAQNGSQAQASKPYTYTEDNGNVTTMNADGVAGKILTKKPDGSYTIGFNDGKQYWYDKNGNDITKAVDAGAAAPQFQPKTDNSELKCDWDNLTCMLAKAIYYITIKPASWLVWASGWLFDVVFDKTVVNLSTTLGKSSNTGFYPVISMVWGIFRDLINMTFIFVLLYASIITILKADTSGMKKTVGAVVVAAVLINFSLFFTEVIIDVSNNFAVAIHNNIIQGESDNISAGFMKTLNLQTLMSSAQSSGKGGNYTNMITISIFGSVFLLILAVIFFIVAILFVVRFVTFIILLMMSPVGIGGAVVPKLQETLGKNFWHDLLDQCFFAPVFMLFLWVILKILTAITSLSGQSGPTDLAGTFTGVGDQKSIGYFLLSFTVVIFLLIKALEISKSMSTSGAKGIQEGLLKYSGANMVQSFAKSIPGRTASRAVNATGGRVANSLANSKFGQKIGSTRLGNGIYNITNKAGAGWRENVDKVAKQEIARSELRTAAATKENDKLLKKQQEFSNNAGILRAEEMLNGPGGREAKAAEVETHTNTLKSTAVLDSSGSTVNLKNIEHANEVKDRINEEIKIASTDSDVANAKIKKLEKEIAAGGVATLAQQTALNDAQRDLENSEQTKAEQQTRLKAVDNLIKPAAKATKELEKIDADLKKLYSGYNAENPDAAKSSARAIRNLAQDIKTDIQTNKTTSKTEVVDRATGAKTTIDLAAAISSGTLNDVHKQISSEIRTLQTEIKNQEIHESRNSSQELRNTIGFGLNHAGRQAAADQLRQKYMVQSGGNQPK